MAFPHLKTQGSIERLCKFWHANLSKNAYQRVGPVTSRLHFSPAAGSSRSTIAFQSPTQIPFSQAAYLTFTQSKPPTDKGPTAEGSITDVALIGLPSGQACTMAEAIAPQLNSRGIDPASLKHCFLHDANDVLVGSAGGKDLKRGSQLRQLLKLCPEVTLHCSETVAELLTNQRYHDHINRAFELKKFVPFADIPPSRINIVRADGGTGTNGEVAISPTLGFRGEYDPAVDRMTWADPSTSTLFAGDLLGARFKLFEASASRQAAVPFPLLPKYNLTTISDSVEPLRVEQLLQAGLNRAFDPNFAVVCTRCYGIEDTVEYSDAYSQSAQKVVDLMVRVKTFLGPSPSPDRISQAQSMMIKKLLAEGFGFTEADSVVAERSAAFLIDAFDLDILAEKMVLSAATALADGDVDTTEVGEDAEEQDDDTLQASPRYGRALSQASADDDDDELI